MNHRKKVLGIMFFIALTFVVSPGLAVHVEPGIHPLKQNDGSQFNATFWGDEWVSGGETIDGYSIIFNETTKNWAYAILGAEGNLLPSINVVGKDSPPIAIPKHLRPTGNAQEEIIELSASQAPAFPAEAAPVTGTANIPVILINFKDTSTTYTPANFNTLLFSSGTKSMKDYYEEVSYGTFSIASGPGGIAGWYTASQNHDYYGYTNGYPRAAALVKEAVQKADAAGYDFSSYDKNNDGYVDAVTVVHQGLGRETTLDGTNIHSHRWYLSSASGVGNYTTTSGKIVDMYVIDPETRPDGMITMGVFAHEYGHALGLRDLYDYTDASMGIGDWSLMASGDSNKISRNGDTPAHLDAWSKSVLGWVSPTQVSTTSITQIKEAEHNREAYQLLDNPNGIDDWTREGTGKGEYFLVENRRKIGFDAALPGEGLLIWHIDESIGTNDDKTHKLVDLEEADGLNHLDSNTTNSGDAFDPWYNKIVGFTSTSTPNSHFYNGSDSGIQVTNIGTSGTTMTANLVVPGHTIPGPTVTSITPTSGNNTGSVSITNLAGTNFANGATVHLSGTGSGSGNPVHKGSISNGAGGALLDNPLSVYVSGNYAYVASLNSNALEIIDVSNPANPVHKGSISNGAGGALLNGPRSVYVSGNYAYVASLNSNALEIIDVSNPANPVHKGSISNGAGGALLDSPISVYVSGNYAYVASVDNDALEIVDVSNPANPVHKGSISNGANGALLDFPYNVFVSGYYAYIAVDYSNALEIVDVSNPANPVHKGSISNGAGGALLGGPTCVYVSGNYAYVASLSSHTLEIVDISNPANPVHKGSISNDAGGALLNYPEGVFVSGNYAYVASPGSNALEIVDVSNPANPVHKASIINGAGGALLNSPASVFVSGNYAYVVSRYSNALEIIEITGGSSPVNVYATGVSIVSPTRITGTFPLIGVPTGWYNVVVTNPDAKQGTLINGFRVTDTGPSEGTKIGIYNGGNWYMDYSGDGQFIPATSDRYIPYGATGWTQLVGDWNGDGTSEIGIYKDGLWYIDYGGSGVIDANTRYFSFGGAGWTPIVGDWNGDARDEIGVYNAGNWYLDYDGTGGWSSGDRNYGFGTTGWMPVTGKWTNDGYTKIGIYNGGNWYIDYNGDGQFIPATGDRYIPYGATGWTNLIGDWNGDGTSEIGIYKDGLWYIDYGGSGVIDANTRYYSFGGAGWTPIVADWNADKKDEIGVYQNGNWYLDNTGNGAWDAGDLNYGFGAIGWTPVVGKW